VNRRAHIPGLASLVNRRAHNPCFVSFVVNRRAHIPGLASLVVNRRAHIPGLYSLNLGCLHPVARVRSDDVGFYPSMQRHYRMLIYYLYIT
jgi:hypothetical protein